MLDDTVIDYLERDYTAYTVANENETRRVLLISDQRNVFLEEVLRSLPNVQIFRGNVSNGQLPTTPYDLYIFNNYLPDTLPDADMLIINPPRSTDIFTLGAVNSDTANMTVVNRSHPLASFVSMDSVNLREFPNMTAVDWATPIVSTAGGDVILAGENRGRQVAIISFNLLDSDLPLQIAFPILMSNAVEWMTPANIISGGTAFNIGDVIRINPPLDATAIQINLPDGQTRDLDITGNSIVFADTLQHGFYEVNILVGETISTSQTIAINLFGADESNITPLAEGTLNLGGGELDPDAEEQVGFREWWQSLLILALLVLIYEWRVYFQRLQAPTTLETDLRRTTARN